MSIKEIITYVLGFAGLILMCYVRMQFTKRQQAQPDNAYTKKEEIMHKIAIGLFRYIKKRSVELLFMHL